MIDLEKNEAIIISVKNAGVDYDVDDTRTKGVEQEIFVKKFYVRISTHTHTHTQTQRRSFITIVQNNGVADKTIMSMSDHKDIKTFNMYDQVSDLARINAVNRVFRDF